MYRLVLILFYCSLFVGCTSDSKVREDARAAATAMATNNPVTDNTETKADLPPIVPAEELAVGQTPPTIDLALKMGIATVEADKGSTACLPVSASGFTDLIGLQFSIRWNPEELLFGQVTNFELPDLIKSNFGLTHVDKGVAVLSWIKQDLSATSMAHNAKLFDICFAVNAEVGTSATVQFSASPTPYEVITAQEEIMKFEGSDGGISVK